MQMNKQAGTGQKAGSEAYWLKKMSGDPDKRSFPYDYKLSPSTDRVMKSIGFSFPDEVCGELVKFCGDSNLKLYKILVSAVSVLLDKYSYESLKDIIVGAPVCKCDPETGRELETRPANTVVALRNYLDDAMSFNELLMEVRQTIIGAYENQDFPMEKLLERLEMPAAETEFPLFDVTVSLVNIHGKNNLRNIPVNMLFAFSRTGNNLEGEVEYNASLYEAATIERIFEHLVNLLKTVIVSPGMDLSELDILSAEERELLVHGFNDFEMEYPKEKTINHVFEEQVAKTPGALAVVDEDNRLNYRQFDEKINQLARALREKGVGRNSIVGLMVERTVEMMIGIFGILRAGGAYLPIGIKVPETRRDFMLEDSDAVVFLTQSHLVSKEAAPGNTMIIDDTIFTGDTSAPENVNEPRDLAYVIYTSGTTGKPKGVMVEHWNVINLVYGLQERIYKDYGPNLKAVLVAPYIFDASVQQIFGVLLLGHALHMVPEDTRVDGAGLIEYYHKYGIEISDGTPSHLRLMLAAANDKRFDFKVKHFLIGGEALPKQVVDSFLNNFETPAPIITNVYGPTECCVDSSSFKITIENISQIKGDIITIGKPMPNEHMYIVNKKHALQPLGAPGELCIGGDGVARGYLKRKKLTAEKFIPHPLSENKTLYKTGDIARWMPDGNIAFMDRIDHQVKIRGFRIEIGEIESQLLKQPGVKETIVLARDDGDGEKYLCAYLVPDTAGSIDASALRSALEGSLPSYMVPTYFVPIEKIPLTPNGKIDRKALPDPRDMELEKEADYVAPRNEIEEKLADIWSEVLKMKKDMISIDGNFFKLGGHSLKASVMITLIHKALDVKLKMSEIFDMPTIRRLGEHIKGAEEIKYRGIEPAPPKEYYIQTSAQKRLYFFAQLEKNSTLYNMPLLDIYHKNTQKDKLEEVFRQLIKRHESLRTSFLDVDGIAVQKIHDYEEVASAFELEYYETDDDGMIFSDLPGKEWTKVTGLPIQDVVEHFVRPFDLSKPPLIRAGLIDIAGAIQILMLDQHHICGDGVSTVILIDELWHLYDGKELPPVSVHYKDYAEWAEKDEQKTAIKKLEPFWLKQFEEEMSPLNLPTDYPRPGKRSFDGDTVFFEISKEETDRLNRLALEQGETLFMALFAVFNVLMAKLSGQDDIVAGTVTAGRGHADVQEIIGMFVGTLALRNYPKGDKTFKEFLAEVKDRTIAAFENQDYPLEELVAKVAPRADAGRNPLFDVVFELENEDDRTEYLLEALMLDTSNPYQYKNKTSKFDMLMVAVETEIGLQFKIEYSTKLFKESTIERFIRYYEQIVSTVCRNIDQKIAEIDMLPEMEREKILYDFNGTHTEYPRDKSITELFETQVAKTPENIAVVFYDSDTQTRKPITYRALNRKADQLAFLLQKKGIVSGGIVGMMAKKSVEMMIGIVASLKAGGAYLPLNPDYPVERKKYIFDDCNARVLLTNFEDPGDFAPEVIDLDDQGIYKGQETFSRNYSDDTLAYIMYTSGSTGKPKGVMVDHINVVRLVMNTDFLDFTEEHRILQTGALEFDASTFEIWGALLQGSSFYLVSKDTILNADKLKTTMNTNKITTIWMTAALFNQMLDTDPDIFSSLKYLLTGGDIVSPSHVRRLKAHVPGIAVINGYGPTENTTFSTTHRIEKEYIDSIPIGKPIANSTVYILDKFHRLVPIGVAGELYTGGDGVSRGYLNNQEMTGDKFFPDPFIDRLEVGGSWMYATGDVARWLTNGNIEFMGRIDFQVKIRGFRIEPGEIDNRLMNIDFIEDAIVIARKEPGSSHHYLCAYIVSPQKVDIGKLKALMLEDLPAYMIPSYFTQMDALPLNSNGKVDRRALPEPQLESTEEEYVPPETENEKLLAEIWQEVLGLKRVSIDDDFFQIGGDSIKTILISARLLKRGLSINVNDIFVNPSIRQLAMQVKTVERTIDQGAVSGNVDTTPIQQWFFKKAFEEKHHFNQSVLFYRKNGFDETVIKKVFTKIVSHHDALRMIYRPDDDTVVQENRGIDGTPFDLKVLQLTKKENSTAADEIKSESNKIQQSIDLRTGPLVKLCLFKGAGDNGDHLLVVIHHSVVDGISWRILIEDFEEGVRQAEKGKEITFQDKTDSFQFWAQNLKEYAGSVNMSEELSYWKRIEEIGAGTLPVDHTIGERERNFGRNGIVPMILPEKKTEQLLTEVNWVYNTEINDVLLTAVGLAVKEWTGISNVPVNLEGHGRENIMENVNIDRTVGWFTTQYPVILDMENAEDISFSIKNVKETLRRVPNKGIGHGILKYLTPREKKQNVRFGPPPEIIFNYLGQFGDEKYDVIDSISEISDPCTGDSIAPNYNDDYKIDIEGVVVDGKLKLDFFYHTNEYEKETIEKLARILNANLEKVIDHCVENKKKIQSLGKTPREYHIERDHENYLEQVKQEQWANLSEKNDYRHILQTGGTGFLGAHILAELLKNTDASLYLPIRGASQEVAEERFEKRFIYYFGEDFFNTHKDRFTVIRSDLSEDRLGMENSRYADLIDTVDAIVHPAANVKHHGTYEALYKDNVVATEKLLELAAAGKKKDFHFISTISVGEGNIPGREYILFTEYCSDVGMDLEHIYLKSKFEAEKRVLAYREKGVNGSIYRVGNLIFHTDTGKFQENIGDDFFYNIIKGAVKLEMLSDKMKEKMVFDMSFINYTAGATVLLLLCKGLKNQTYHVLNPNTLPMTEMAGYLGELGFKLNEVKSEEEYLSKFEGDNEYEKIIQLMKVHSWVFEEKEGTQASYRIDMTVMLLKELGLEWPKTDKKLVEKMIAHCKEVGFF